MVHVAKLDFNGDPNVGLRCVATDAFVLVGSTVPKKYLKELKAVFKVPVIPTRVYGTDLVGIFVAATSKVVLVPEVIFEDELVALKKSLKGIAEVKTVKTDHTALANNILCNDKVGFISKEYSKARVEKIAKLLGIKLIQTNMADTEVPGSCGALTNKGGIFNINLSDSEIKKIEKSAGFEIGLGSVNMGNPLLGSGAVANSNGFIVGALSSGYEISRFDESLGFIK